VPSAGVRDRSGIAQENFRLLEQLRALGVKVALDDFGSGYPSLGYLREFPFHQIKIDRTFMADDSLQAYAILDSVTQLGHALGARVTAEGAETEDPVGACVVSASTRPKASCSAGRCPPRTYTNTSSRRMRPTLPGTAPRCGLGPFAR
jgi:predicted signal transduction protein with EAL and GGDEF domain